MRTHSDVKKVPLVTLPIIAILIALTIFADGKGVSQASYTGATNMQYIPQSSSYLDTTYSISSSITTSGSSYTTDGCTHGGQWDDQMNLEWYNYTGGTLIVPAVQLIAVVNEQSSYNSGYSCWDVQFWPNALTGSTTNDYYYGFAIGYSTELYSTGYSASELDLAMSPAWTASGFYLFVQSDNWVIYPTQLKNAMGHYLSIMPINSSNVAETFNMVGVSGGRSVSFSAGAGTLTYDAVTSYGTAAQYTGENSNMVYGSPSCSSPPPTCTQSYTY